MISSLHKVISEYKSFFFLYGIFILIIGAVLILYSKEETFFFVNSYHSPVADMFFKGLTHLGDGMLFILVIVALAFYRYRHAALGLIIFLTSSLIAQVLKLTLFDNVKRPIGYFGKDIDIHFVDGVTRHVNNSFPSGHTTTAFALVIFVVLIFKLKKSGWLMALLAILIGYSRVYLAVHFPIDIFFGSLLGLISGLLIYIWLYETFKSKFGDKGLIFK